MQYRDACAPSIGFQPGQTRRPQRFRRRLETWLEAERDQLPLWLPVGLGLGIAAWFVLPGASAWYSFICFALGAALAGLAFGSGHRWGRALGVFALAAAIGCALVWWKSDRVAAPRLAYERLATFDAQVETYQRLAAKQTVRLIVRPLDPGLPPRLRINLDEEKAEGIDAGARIHLRAWLMPPASMAVPGAYDFARVAWFQRIGGTGRAIEVRLLEPPARGSLGQSLAGLRQRLADHIQSRLQGGEGGIATALATGDQGAIPLEDAEAMRRSGLAHLRSVSGLHLTAMVGAVMILTVRLLALSPLLALKLPLILIAAAAGALAGVGYTLLTGAEVPTVRACVAALLVLTGMALGREALTMRLLCIGALVILLLWPESLVGPSFQLSFAAIAAIVALHDHPRIKFLVSRREEGGFARL